MESVPTLTAASSFREAAGWFAALVAAVPVSAWDAPGLGTWSVRDLVGHTSRALSTVSEYLTEATGEADLSTTLDYYRVLAVGSGPDSVELNASIAERGRRAGAQLGHDPYPVIHALCDRVVAQVEATDLKCLAGSRGGTIRLGDYLPTRTLELVVHGLDLERALRIVGVGDLPEAPDGAMDDALSLLVGLAVAGSQTASLIMALTGRGGVPEGYSVL